MKNKQKIKSQKRLRRKARVRAKVFGTKKIPRLSVYRSLNHIYAQLIDDEKGETLVAASDLELDSKILKQLKHGENRKPAIIENVEKTLRTQKKNSESLEGFQSPQRLQGSEFSVIAGKTFIAHQVGKLLAQKAGEKKIKKCVFDKSGYKYHGRVKAVAEGAREGGLRF